MSVLVEKLRDAFRAGFIEGTRWGAAGWPQDTDSPAYKVEEDHFITEAEQSSSNGVVVSDVDFARFVNEIAQCISGAPFPSKRSLAKARQVAEMAIAKFVIREASK